ncbi:MAG: DivIVA domain-containing protein, partial [Acidimicrobiia bacterium]|nr:DivIVA domain-containing protein [Acidimicrobiia bacterium]
MPLNPIDVQQKTFGTALRGYDLDEVDDFLDSVVTALKDYESQLAESRDRVAELERQLAERGDSEGAIARALVAAQRSADMIIEEARVQATETAAAAKTEAAKTIEDARGEASQLTATREAEEDALRVEIASIQQRA